MKSLLLLCAAFTCQCLAQKSLIDNSVQWIVDSLPEDTLFDLQSEVLRFQGCKHRNYQIFLAQPLTRSVSLETAIGYSKGQLNWGVFGQTISMYEMSLVPRVQVSEKLSFGLGLVTQSQVRFKTTQGLAIDLPSNKQWLASARIQGLVEDHYWEFTLSSQKWQATNSSNNWFDRGVADNKINLSYTGAF